MCVGFVLRVCWRDFVVLYDDQDATCFGFVVWIWFDFGLMVCRVCYFLLFVGWLFCLIYLGLWVCVCWIDSVLFGFVVGLLCGTCLVCDVGFFMLLFVWFVLTIWFRMFVCFDVFCVGVVWFVIVWVIVLLYNMVSFGVFICYLDFGVL